MTDALTEHAGARQGLLLILSSPSGAGKSTISRRLLAREEDIEFSISMTTRKPRLLEVDGRDYHFIDRDRFDAMIANNDLVEYAEVFSEYYGTPRKPVEEAINCGKDMLFDVDWQGGLQIRNSPLQHAVVSIFILPPSIDELGNRLKSRAQDSDEVIKLRMKASMDEISHWDSYDYVLVNRDLDECSDQVMKILEVERLKRTRRPGLVGMVRELGRQYEDRWS